MTTVQQLIDRVRREYLPGRNEPINRLTTTINDTDTSVAVDFAEAALAAGTRISIELEDIRVWSVSGQTATVARGLEGTTAAAHDAGVIVRVDPQWSDFQILRALNDTIRGFVGDGVYAMNVAEDTFTTAYVGWELPEDCLSVYQVWAHESGSEREWVPLRGWQVARSQSTTDFASGLSLSFTREFPDEAEPFRIQYRAAIAELVGLTDTVSDSGTTNEVLLALGAAVKLTQGEERTRNTLPASARYQEIPPGARTGVNRELRRAYMAELAAEKARLARFYPSIRR